MSFESIDLERAPVITLGARQRRPAESLMDWIARIDPDVAGAVVDVDLTLLRQSLSLSPLQRADACTRATRALARFRRVTP